MEAYETDVPPDSLWFALECVGAAFVIALAIVAAICLMAGLSPF